MVKIQWATEITLVPVLTGGEVQGRCGGAVVACRLRTINIMAVCLMWLSESSMLTDDLLERERNGSRERKED